MHMDRSLVAPLLRNSNDDFCYLLGGKFFTPLTPCVYEMSKQRKKLEAATLTVLFEKWKKFDDQFSSFNQLLINNL